MTHGLTRRNFRHSTGGFIEGELIMNEDAVLEILKKNPLLKAARHKLEAMQPGTYCIHRSWGFGKITAYDDTDGKLIIDFEDKEGHRMDPAFCVTTMDVLAPDHILARKQTESDVIETLITENQAQIVIDRLN